MKAKSQVPSIWPMQQEIKRVKGTDICQIVKTINQMMIF